MGLEATFYIIGIVAMTLWIVIFLVVIFTIFKVKKEIEAFKTGFMGKLVGLLKERNIEVASALGLSAAHFVIDKVKKNLDSKRKKS